MKYNFNEKIDRSENNSAKWLDMKNKFISNDLLPMWIADMDVKVAPPILEAIREKATQDIFGYVSRPDSYYQAAADWCERRFGYKFDPKTLIHSPGVNLTINTLVKMLTNEGDGILLHTPVYYPFIRLVNSLKRELVDCPLLRNEEGQYFINFDYCEELLKSGKVKLMIFVNPNNPLGRLWKREELERLGNLCIKYNVRVISDEIWRDLVLPGNEHIPFAFISKEIENNTITCFSPTKAFNLAGLHASFAAFPRREDWENFDFELDLLDVRRNNHFSLVAVEAAYTKCDEWLDELLLHIEENIDYAIDYINKNIPEIKAVKSGGTYLLWADFAKLNMNPEELSHFIQHEAKIAFDDGIMFGENGATFQRINLACPRYMVEDCMKRLDTAITKWREKNGK